MTDTLTAERELDALIGDFQVACEECMECSNPETMMERAILRNALRSKLLAATARITALEAALDALLTHYVRLVESGDAGFWDADDEPVVKQARTALARTARSAT